LRLSRHLVDDPAMNRRLVACGLVGPDTFRMEASDGTVWLHRVERDELGSPLPEQIHRWLNLIWAPPGMDDVLTAGLRSDQKPVVIPGTGKLG
jgi:glucose/arabinose dehydrogenase